MPAGADLALGAGDLTAVEVDGVGALGGPIAYEAGLLQAGERQIGKVVGAVVLGEAFAEVGQHAVAEAGTVQLHGQRVCEVDAAAHRFGGELSAGQSERALIDARECLAVFLLPACLPGLKPIEGVWARVMRSPANLAILALDRFEVLVRNRLKRLQCRSGTLDGFMAGTGLTPGTPASP